MVKKDSAPRDIPARTRLTRPITYMMAAAFLPLALPVLAVPAAYAEALPGGQQGQCQGADCPETLPTVDNGPFAGPFAGSGNAMPDNAMPDTSAQDSSRNSAAQPDSDVSNGVTQDGGMPDEATQDSATPDQATQRDVTPDQAAQDGATQDSGAPDGATQDNAAQDSGTQGPGTWDQSTQDGKDHPNSAGSTTIIKVDERTGRPLAGAVFQLWHESNGVPGLQTGGANADAKVGAPCTTQADGECSTDSLPLGTYYWQETTPPPGYDLPDQTVTKVVLDWRHPCAENVVKDRRTYTPTGFTSEEKVDARTGRPLSGATFQLWHETNGIPGLQTTGPNPDTKVDGQCVTPSNGVCSADHLPLGTYYWQEISAPPGYDLPNQPVSTVVLDRDHAGVWIVVKDRRSHKPYGSTSVKKVDARKGWPLAGATFQLWRETNGIKGLQATGGNTDTKVGAPCVTPASGICSATNLPLGTYYWQETAAPRGYRVAHHPVTTVVLDHEHACVQIVVKDWRRHWHHGHLPETGFAGGTLGTAGAALMGAGGLVTAATKRRRARRS